MAEVTKRITASSPVAASVADAACELTAAPQEKRLIETSYQKRQEAVFLKEASRDSIVRAVVAEYHRVTFRSERKTAQGWNADYMIDYNGQPYHIIDTATTREDQLAPDLRRQLDSILDRPTP